MCLQPYERFELSTPCLQDQCSNYWANEVDTLGQVVQSLIKLTQG